MKKVWKEYTLPDGTKIRIDILGVTKNGVVFDVNFEFLNFNASERMEITSTELETWKSQNPNKPYLSLLKEHIKPIYQLYNKVLQIKEEMKNE